MAQIFKVFLLILFSSALVSRAELCSHVMGGTQPLTTQFLAYVKILMDRSIIDSDDLANFELHLRQGHWCNVVQSLSPHENQYSSVEREIHATRLEEYLQNTSALSSDLILAKLREWSLKGTAEHVQRQSSLKKTTSSLLKFARIEPGTFMYNDTEITLTHPIEVMDQPVTVKVWREIFRTESPLKAQSEIDDSVPFVGLTYWSALEFANRLSTKFGYPVTYGLDAIQFHDGFLDGKAVTYDQGQGRILTPNQDIYEAKGFRLPTWAEQVYLLTNLGKVHLRDSDFKDHFSWGRKSDISIAAAFGLDPAWQQEAELSDGPYKMGGHRFFGLFKYLEWNGDDDGLFAEIFSRNKIVDPARPILVDQSLRLVHASWLHFRREFVYSNSRGLPNGREGTSLRLIRTIE